MNTELPPLPEPDCGLGPKAHWATYSDDAMHAYARLAIQQHMARLAPLVMQTADEYVSAMGGDLSNVPVNSPRAALAKLLEVEE